MKKRNSYYTPDISEFHIGFEYEQEDINEEGSSMTWYKRKIENGSDIDAIIKAEENGALYRVAHIKKEDFLSLGFNKRIKEDPFYGKIDVFIKKIGSPFASIMKTVSIKNIDNKFLIELEESGSYSNTTNQFWIELKNKWELKKLLKQLRLIR